MKQLPKITILFSALRGGSTMLRLMLNNHSDIYCPGERDFIFQYVDANGSIDKKALSNDRIFQDSGIDISNINTVEDFITEDMKDREENNYVIVVRNNLELVLRYFPNSKFIHYTRDPRDVARSSIGMGWAGNVYFGVDHWIDTENNWTENESRMRLLPILNFRYEDILTNPNFCVLVICKFIGVLFERKMLEFHMNSTYSEINPNLANQWKRKLTSNQIRLVESKAKEQMIKLGYQMITDESKLDANSFERLYLFLQNKIHVWSFKIRRFGLKNVVLNKISQYVNLNAIGVKNDMNDIERNYLK